jgi:hypothetical protein
VTIPIDEDPVQMSFFVYPSDHSLTVHESSIIPDLFSSGISQVVDSSLKKLFLFWERIDIQASVYPEFSVPEDNGRAVESLGVKAWSVQRHREIVLSSAMVLALILLLSMANSLSGSDDGWTGSYGGEESQHHGFAFVDDCLCSLMVERQSY